MLYCILWWYKWMDQAPAVAAYASMILYLLNWVVFLQISPRMRRGELASVAWNFRQMVCRYIACLLFCCMSILFAFMQFGQKIKNMGDYLHSSSDPNYEHDNWQDNDLLIVINTNNDCEWWKLRNIFCSEGLPAAAVNSSGHWRPYAKVVHLQQWVKHFH